MGRFSIWSSIFRYEEVVPLSDELWRKVAPKSDKIFQNFGNQKSKLKIFDFWKKFMREVK